MMVVKKKEVCVKTTAKKVTAVTIDAMDRGALRGERGISANEARSRRILRVAKKLSRYSTEAHTERDTSRGQVFSQASTELRALLLALEKAEWEVRTLKGIILKMQYPLRDLRIDQATATVDFVSLGEEFLSTRR